MRISLKDKMAVWNEVYENTASAKTIKDVNEILFSKQNWRKRVSNLEAYVVNSHLIENDKAYISTLTTELIGYVKKENISYSFEVEEGIAKIQNELIKTEEERRVDAWKECVEEQNSKGLPWLVLTPKPKDEQQIGPIDIDALLKLREKKYRGLIKSTTPYEQTLFERMRGYAHKKLVGGIAIGAVLIGSFWFGYHQYNKNIDLQQKNKSQYEQIAKFGDEKASLEKSVYGLEAKIADINEWLEERDKLIGLYSKSQGELTNKLDDCTSSLNDCYNSKRGLQAEMEKLKGKIVVTKKYKDPVTTRKPVDTTKLEKRFNEIINETKVLEPQKQEVQPHKCTSNKHIGNKGNFIEGKMYYPDCICNEPALYSGHKESSASRFGYQR